MIQTLSNLTIIIYAITVMTMLLDTTPVPQQAQAAMDRFRHDRAASVLC